MECRSFCKIRLAVCKGDGSGDDVYSDGNNENDVTSTSRRQQHQKNAKNDVKSCKTI